ncbi:MAG: ribonuclease J [Deltaproteobacteria bacterium]|nr:ribonuclease J [Deltaproteobacteria bacterium]
MPQTQRQTDKKLRLLPLGGLGEIGMNCLVVEYGPDLVLIDCGVQFPDSHWPGMDLLVPDFSYVRDRLDSLKAVVVTHGHDDHIGAIPYLLKERDLDVYATPFPTGLISQKLAEHSDLKEIRFHKIENRKRFTIGPFTFDPIPVQHSIIEALAFAIETPAGVVIHSGDFKHDAHETSQGKIGFEPFQEWGDLGVKLLLSDSTNAERPGHTLSEMEIKDSFTEILNKQTGRVVIALFASNIKRVEKLMHLVHSQGKKVAFAGRSMHTYTKLAFEQNSLKIPPETLVLLENIGMFPDDKIVVLVTGSQAEPQSALLRISEGIHKDFQIKKGDLVVMSSRFIPGNEKAISKMIDQLYRSGAQVIYESIHQVHVSGHGQQEELLMMLKATRPQFFIPIHGAYRHLSKHAKLAEESGVALENIRVIEDGQLVELSDKGLESVETIELKKAVVVGTSFVEGSPDVFAQRNNLAKTGVVFAVFMRDVKTLKLIAPPAVKAYGLMYFQGEKPEYVAEDAEDHLEDVYYAALHSGELEETLRLEGRRFFKKKVSHKPVFIPLVLDV